MSGHGRATDRATDIYDPVLKSSKNNKNQVRPARHGENRSHRNVGRVLAENIIADSDLPPFDRSQMDGFAVITKDTAKLL